jgi:hypothetical protein
MPNQQTEHKKPSSTACISFMILPGTKNPDHYNKNDQIFQTLKFLEKKAFSPLNYPREKEI